MPVQLDLEDYYMWQYEYKVGFKNKVGQAAQLTLEATDLFGRWGQWFFALDWLQKGAPDQEYILQVEYEQVRHSLNLWNIPLAPFACELGTTFQKRVR